MYNYLHHFGWKLLANTYVLTRFFLSRPKDEQLPSEALESHFIFILANVVYYTVSVSYGTSKKNTGIAIRKILL